MTTLEQIMKQKLDKVADEDTDIPLVLASVKEWLQQKHKYYMTSPLAAIEGRAFLAFDELLEELNQK